MVSSSLLQFLLERVVQSRSSRPSSRPLTMSRTASKVMSVSARMQVERYARPRRRTIAIVLQLGTIRNLDIAA
jgi:hypothetical protein